MCDKEPEAHGRATEFDPTPKRRMKMQPQGETLVVSEIRELGAATSNDFRDQARAALSLDNLRNLEVDLSETMFVDSCGLGALIALHKTVCGLNGLMRLINPTPGVLQILELTRMHRLFEIVKH